MILSWKTKTFLDISSKPWNIWGKRGRIQKIRFFTEELSLVYAVRPQHKIHLQMPIHYIRSTLTGSKNKVVHLQSNIKYC
jgi:hypothetical protein